MELQRAEQSGEIRAGWFLILSACVGVACCSITLPYYSIGMLMGPITANFGWSRAEFEGALVLSTGLGALAAPLGAWRFLPPVV